MQLTYNFLARSRRLLEDTSGRGGHRGVRSTKSGAGVPSFYFINENGRVINKTSPITFIRCPPTTTPYTVTVADAGAAGATVFASPRYTYIILYYIYVYLYEIFFSFCTS